MNEFKKKENNECEEKLKNLENFLNKSVETLEEIIKLKIQEDYFC